MQSRIRCSGRRRARDGSIARCSKKFRCLWTGPSMSAMPRRWRMRVGQESRFRQKSSGTGPHTALTDGSERYYPWGSEAPNSSFGNFDFSHWNPTPVNAFPAGRSAFGVCRTCWAMGGSGPPLRFAPFPGFEPFPFYRGYSADFFDGKHFVMKGGSPRTAACMLRPTFRNWFQAHYQYVYAGFRCVNH